MICLKFHEDRSIGGISQILKFGIVKIAVLEWSMNLFRDEMLSAVVRPFGKGHSNARESRAPQQDAPGVGFQNEAMSTC